MTHHDLAELLRDHVAHDEPPAPLPHPALAAGRRRLRTRRLSRAGVAAAVLAVAGAVAVPRLGGDEAATAMDPASAAALADYDAHAMPELMDQHVRRVLEESAPDLGPSTFAARDDQGQSLPERYWDKASSLVVSYGDDAHGYGVTIAHSRGEAEGDPERYCRDGLDQGYYLDCTVERTADGAVVISKLWATKPHDFGGQVPDRTVVRRSQLDRVPVAGLSFERSIKVIKSETLITYVDEHVAATSADPATAAFETPVADLVAIGTDAELVMPVPPPGAGGCPAWTLPADEGGMDVTCSSTP